MNFWKGLWLAIQSVVLVAAIVLIALGITAGMVSVIERVMDHQPAAVEVLQMDAEQGEAEAAAMCMQ